MKSLLLLLLVAPIFVVAQIPPKSNTVIVRGVTFEQCVNTLLDMGYEVAKMDKDFQTVRTEFKQVDDVKKIKGWNIAIAVRVKDSTAFITSYSYDKSGVFRTDKQKDIDDFQIEFRESKLTLNRELFSVMDAYAKKLNPVVEYAKN